MEFFLIAIMILIVILIFVIKMHDKIYSNISKDIDVIKNKHTYEVKDNKILLSRNQELNKSNNSKEKQKPYLWLYVNSDKTSLHWPTFFGRRSITNPEYINLSIATLHHHCSNDFKIILLNNENIYKYLPEFDKKLIDDPKNPMDRTIFYISLLILNKYGGLWISPSIIFKPLTQIKEAVNNFEFVTFSCNKNIYRCNSNLKSLNTKIYGSKSNTQFLKQCIKETKKIIYSYNYPSFEFDDMQNKILTKYLNENKDIKHYQFSEKIIGTRDYDNKVVDVSNLLSTNNTLLLDSKDTLLLIIDIDGINNNLKYKWFQRMDKKQILESNLWIAKLFRKSLDYKDKTYWDVTDLDNKRLINYEVNYETNNKKNLKELIKESNLYFIQPWNQVFNSASRNS